MRKTICFLFFSLLTAVPASAIQQVNYTGELAIDKPVSITIDNKGQLYISQKDGTVGVLNTAGETVMTLGGKDKKWKAILKKPAGLAVYNEKLYVTDSSLCHIAVFDKDGTYLETFGRKGTGFREFKNPQAIYAYRGVFFVADTGNNRIQVFGPNFVFLREIGTQGDEPARLREPLDLVVDHRGYIYVTDGKAGSLKVYTQDGNYLQTIEGIGKARSLAIDDGIYISDLSGTNIKKYDFNFNSILSFGTKGNGRAQFGDISGIAADREGKIYVTDPKRNLIQIFQPERNKDQIGLEQIPPPVSIKWLNTLNIDKSRKISKIIWNGIDTIYAVDAGKHSVLAIKNDGTSVEISTPPDCRPVSIALDRENNLWVLGEQTIIKFKKDSEVDFNFGTPGSSEGCLSRPADIAVSKGGMVYIADKGNRRVQVFNVDGIFIRVIGNQIADDLIKSPVALDVDDDGILYVLDGAKKSVIAISPEGSLIKEFSQEDPENKLLKEPADIAVAGARIHVLDAGTENIKIFSKDGNLSGEYGSGGSDNGELKNPASMAFMDDITLLIADTGNNRIQRFVIADIPGIPVHVEARGGTRSVNIYWDKAAESFVQKYRIYRSETPDGRYDLLAETDIASYVDKKVEPDRLYYYKISTLAREGNESLRSETVSAAPSKLITPPPSGIKATPNENAITLTWDKTDDEHFAYYVIYREVDNALKEIGRTKTSFFTENDLEPDSSYGYSISAVSTDMVESEKITVNLKTTIPSRPPLEIDVLELHDIFSNTYKAYERDGIGVIRITNNTKNPINRLRVLFNIKNFMDFPSEVEIDSLAPGERKELMLKAVFNNKLLDVIEDTPVQTEITVHYYLSENRKTFSKNHTINIYEKHKMTWDDRNRVAAFVTTKDPVLLEFTRDIVTQYGDTSDPLLYASVIFNAFGVMGITYMQDPANSFQVTSEKTDTVDYLQYPRETLRRKSGDCDDLVILYSAALESLGINTKFIEVPGHIFMMFAIGKTEDIGNDTMDGLFVIDSDQVWAPVEVTMVGKPFMTAWEAGSKKYYEWADKDLHTTSLHEAWTTYKPATLASTEWRPDDINRNDIEKRFNNEFSEIRKIKVKIWKKRHVETLQKNPDDVNALLQLGISYAEEGETGEAMKLFKKAASIDPENAALLNNIGNVDFLEGRYQEASISYEKSLSLDGKDHLVWVNLAKSYLRLNKTDEAKKAFTKACEIEPEVSKEYRSMALKLLGPM